MADILDVTFHLPIKQKNLENENYVDFIVDSLNKNYDIGNFQFSFLLFHMLYMIYIYVTLWKYKTIEPLNFSKSIFIISKNEESIFNKSTSPFDFSFFPESKIIRLLKLLDCNNDDIGKFLHSVKIRNDICHSNGSIIIKNSKSYDIETDKIYRNIINIQKKLTPLISNFYIDFINDNLNISDWEYTNPDDVIREAFIHKHFILLADIADLIELQKKSIGRRKYKIELHNSLISFYKSQITIYDSKNYIKDSILKNKNNSQSISLGSLFSSDHKNLSANFGDLIGLKIKDHSIPTLLQKHYNCKINIYFIRILFLTKIFNIEGMKKIVDNIDRITNRLDSIVGGTSKSHDYHEVKLNDLVFSNKIFFYSETFIDIGIKQELHSYASDRGLSVEVYDLNYLEIKKQNPVAFISYDYSAKSDVVVPLVQRLIKEGIVIWYDDFEIKIGDSIHDKIQSGLSKCDKCILIISPEYIKNKKWAKREFDSITALEIQSGKNRILPIWHNVAQEEVMQLSLHLGNIKALKTDNFDKLVGSLIKVLK
ncbi:MAG: toll/interleukin-1 receptor domain-containing protein [Candidatus Stygibacter frigidus]|nr:toll/interleukin-1 receptor domain-containing protein [Candidatus Stygibacter frigidus]